MTKGRTGRACTICIHPSRAAIDAGLLVGRSHAELSRDYKLSDDALGRHARRHVSVAAAGQHVGSPVPDPDGPLDVVAGIISLHGRVLALLKKAEAARNFAGALGAIKTAAALLETHARITGQIAPDGTRVAIQVNAAGPGPVAIRERILEKLAALAGG